MNNPTLESVLRVLYVTSLIAMKSEKPKASMTVAQLQIVINLVENLIDLEYNYNPEVEAAILSAAHSAIEAALL